MSPSYYPVHPHLRATVSHIMTVEVHLPGPAYGRSAPFPPTPQHSLNFYPGDATRSRQVGTETFADLPACTIIGPQTTRVDLAMGTHHRFVTVAFHPGGLHRLLRLPLPELLDRPLDAAAVLGSEIRQVNEQLQEAHHSLALKHIVEAYLLRKLSEHVASPLERSLRLLLQSDPAQSIEHLAALSCLSLRQFERRSRDILGYSPKFFARVVRFSQAYRLKVRQPQRTWTAISHECGYYDQMHLIRDFKEFAGTTPKLITRELLAAPLTLQDDLRI